ncbi:hypothetical protein [Massilia glaciei]|uniref:Aromatic ring-opening dioxygenase LigA n=1 Tax=Massilia glaciei TaxID=1524097 RepID=A0A2U2HHP1_9BURK|nr:hypothetical protein [Massilia glaciei]PWF45437.1 hypothetical protein C7C56_017670 [Massilia glaciei]
MDIKLNFVNQSNDENNSQVVIFQKNVASGVEEPAVAWRVIDCGVNDSHPFVFPMAMSVAASDAHGNFSPQMPAQNGQAFDYTAGASGNTLADAGMSTSASEVHVRNKAVIGAIDASIFKDGKIMAVKTSIAPGQQAVFQFKPTIWIGVASQIGQGEVMNTAILSNVNTELSLLGIARADIIMRGGGPGKTSSAFTFTLANVVMA